MANNKDKELIELYFLGNKESAFQQIVLEYQERLYWHIRKIVLIHEDADDVLQNTFIKAWKGLPSFKQESLLYTWIYRIATNEALTFLKKKKDKYNVDVFENENLLTNSLMDDNYYSGDEITTKLHNAIAKLPEKQRLVFNMKYFDEMKYEDISDVLETTVGALKASYHHAVKKIELFLKED